MSQSPELQAQTSIGDAVMQCSSDALATQNYRNSIGQFMPGNPGRPPGVKNYVSEELRNLLESEQVSGKTGARVIAEKYLEIATKGKHGVALAACDSVVDRVEGKPMQQMRVESSIDENTARRIAELYERLSKL